MINAKLAAGIALTALLVAIACLSFAWMPYPPEEMRIAQRLMSPSAAHWLGTDAYGRDVLAMLMVGARSALAVAGIAALIGMGVGIPMGLAAAARPGAVDEAVMRLGDIVFAFPALLTAVLIAATAGAGLGSTVAAVGVFNAPVFARVTRSAALGHWPLAYIQAARLFGKTRWRISIEHILPNIAGVLLVQGAIQLSLAVVAEAGFSYVGLGIQPPAPSWGRMLADAQTLADRAPWLAAAPGTAILLAALAFALLGDGLRDKFDPRLARAAIGG